MIKVLIVDDEPKLREGMRSLIPWEDEGYTVVATAGNGIEALEKYRTLTPDLVLADIRMPGMDGLELIRELRERKAECHVLILSGYADFDYAKQAIQERVDGYLLKPVDEDELIDYLRKIREAVREKERLQEWQDDEPALRRGAVLRELLYRGGAKQELEEVARSLGLAGADVEVVLLELTGGIRTEDAQQEDKVREALEQYWNGRGQPLAFSHPPYWGVVLTSPLGGKEAREEAWQAMSRIIRSEGLDFRSAVGNTGAGAEGVARSFGSARQRLENAFFGRKDVLLSGEPEEWIDPDASAEGTPQQEDENLLLLAIESGSGEAIEALIGQMLRRLVAVRRDEAYVKDNLMRIISAAIARLEAGYPEIRSFIAENASPMSEIYNSGYLSDVRDRSTAYLRQVATQMGGRQGDEIRKITDIIHARYNENLKLGTLAEVFNYNSAYLGKMFRQHTGEQFNTYLDKIRIENAKQFLAQGMKIYEVAEKVGYMNADYFNAKFRKYEGVSPSAFRKKQE